MKLTALALLTIFVATAACSTASSGDRPGSELPTGKEIGETVSKRTKDADVKDNSGVIIASSEDGRDQSSVTPEEKEPAAVETAPIGTWIEIAPDGTMTDAQGETLEAMPESDEAGKIIVRHRAGVSSETIATTIERLRSAGWSEVTVTMVADEADAAGDDAEATPSGAKESDKDEEAE